MVDSMKKNLLLIAFAIVVYTALFVLYKRYFSEHPVFMVLIIIGIQATIIHLYKRDK